MKHECDCGALYSNLNALEACQLNNHGRPRIDPKRFVVFAGCDYYPSGGWRDFLGRHPSLDAARQHGISSGFDWWLVVDLATDEIVATKEHVFERDGSTTDRVTSGYYVHWNGGAWFVKTADFFKEQGGLTADWGKGWRLIQAESIEDARAKAARELDKRSFK